MDLGRAVQGPWHRYRPLASGIALAVCLVAGSVIVGCATCDHPHYSEPGLVTMGLDPQDLVMVADKMARSILSIPQIANAATPPTIVLKPVENQTSQKLDVTLLTERIRNALLRTGRVVVAESSDRNEAALLSGARSLPTPDFTFTGKIIEMKDRSEKTYSSYYNFSFALTATNGLIVWADSAEMKKTGSRPVVGY